MNAQSSLLANFTSMQEEFSSSNNRALREVKRVFESNLDDLLSSLKYFNDEYVVVDIRDLVKEFDVLKNRLKEIWNKHAANYTKKFEKEKNLLKQEMCSFFKEKYVKGQECKRKMSCYIKNSIDKMCDFNIFSLEEELDNAVYDFKVDFEMKHIDGEYCKDDFNKIMRTFKHTLICEIRDKAVSTVSYLQDIVSRYAEKGYQIIDHYKELDKNKVNNNRKVA